MFTGYRKIIFLITAITVQASIAFAQTENGYKAPPLPKGETIWQRHPYYVGMPKEALYKIYPPDSQQNYFKQGNEEWIVYDDILTAGDFKDVIAFYLKDGKVVGWDKKSLPKTPEERLKAIEIRHQHSVGSASSSTATDGSEYKRQERRDEIYTY